MREQAERSVERYYQEVRRTQGVQIVPAVDVRWKYFFKRLHDVCDII